MKSLQNYFKKIIGQVAKTKDFSNEIEDKTFVEQFPFSSKKSILECEKILNIDCKSVEKLVCSWNLFNYF